MSSSWSHYFLWKRFLAYQLQTSHMTKMMTLSPACFDKELLLIQVSTSYEIRSLPFQCWCKVSLRQSMQKSSLWDRVWSPNLSYYFVTIHYCKKLFSRGWIFSILQAIFANILMMETFLSISFTILKIDHGKFHEALTFPTADILPGFLFRGSA